MAEEHKDPKQEKKAPKQAKKFPKGHKLTFEELQEFRRNKRRG